MEAPDSDPVNPLIVEITRNVIEEVKMLASREAQLQYEIGVPIANVPLELVCGWDLFEINRQDLIIHLRPDQLQSLLEIEDAMKHYLAADDYLKIYSVAELHVHHRWSGVITAAAKALPLFELGTG